VTAEAQVDRYSFAFQNIPLIEVLAEIDEATDYSLTYVPESIPNRSISGAWEDIDIPQMLHELFLGEIIGFDIEDNNIIIFSKRSWTDPFQLFGRMSDSESGEVLSGANIYTDAFQGVVSDNYGLYSIEIDPLRDSVLLFQYLGYSPIQIPIDRLDDGRRDIEMDVNYNFLKEVTITFKKNTNIASPPDRNILNAETYSVSKSISGDNDVIEYLNTVPGVTKMSEGRTGFSVHGSATDQNLILLDEAPIFNPSHALGFLSVFNHEALNSANFYKTDISSKYGGRLASVLDIRMREGNSQHFAASLTANPYYSGLTVEGPIIEDQASFLISGRVAHMNYILNGFDPQPPFYVPESINFYDVHGKINFKLGNNNRIYLSSFINNDEIRPYKDSNTTLFYNTQWQNRTLTARWNSIWNDRIFSNASFVFSDYEYNKRSDLNDARFLFQERSNISNSHLKFDLNYHASKNHRLLLGFNGTDYTFQPATGNIGIPETEFNISYAIEDIRSREYAFFLEDNIKIGNHVSLDIGLRYSRFQDIGSDNFDVIYSDGGVPIDSIFRPANKVIRTFDNFEPRASLDYQHSNRWLFRAAYSRTSQYIIRLLNDNPSAPNEYWIPAGLYIKPLTSNIASTHAFGQLNDFTKISIGAFYRTSKNISAFRNGASIFFSESLIDRQVTQGNFKSNGLELSLQKAKAAYQYLISYTYSDAKVRFDDINNGDFYRAARNYTHDLNVQGSLAFSKSISLGFNWQLRSGDIITLPSAIGYVGGIPFEVYNDRNNHRLPVYSRLDLSSNFSLFQSSKIKLDVSAGVFNLTGAQNAFQTRVTLGATSPMLESLALFQATPFLNIKLRYR